MATALAQRDLYLGGVRPDGRHPAPFAHACGDHCLGGVDLPGLHRHFSLWPPLPDQRGRNLLVFASPVVVVVAHPTGAARGHTLGPGLGIAPTRFGGGVDDVGPGRGLGAGLQIICPHRTRGRHRGRVATVVVALAACRCLVVGRLAHRGDGRGGAGGDRQLVVARPRSASRVARICAWRKRRQDGQRPRLLAKLVQLFGAGQLCHVAPAQCRVLGAMGAGRAVVGLARALAAWQRGGGFGVVDVGVVVRVFVAQPALGALPDPHFAGFGHLCGPGVAAHRSLGACGDHLAGAAGGAVVGPGRLGLGRLGCGQFLASGCSGAGGAGGPECCGAGVVAAWPKPGWCAGSGVVRLCQFDSGVRPSQWAQRPVPVRRRPRTGTDHRGGAQRLQCHL